MQIQLFKLFFTFITFQLESIEFSRKCQEFVQKKKNAVGDVSEPKKKAENRYSQADVTNKRNKLRCIDQKVPQTAHDTKHKLKKGLFSSA